MDLSRFVYMAERHGITYAESKLGVRYELEHEGEEKAGGVGWSYLADVIVKKYKSMGFMKATIYGELGAGKSVYSIKIAYDALNRLGFDVSTRDVFTRYMVFRARDLVLLLRQANYKERIPVLIWDDAGVHGDSQLRLVDPVMAMALRNAFRTARTRVAAIIMNTPEADDVLKKVREGSKRFIVLIDKLDEDPTGWSRAHGYITKKLPSGKEFIYKIFMEDFRRYLKDYDEYIPIRDRYADYTLDYLLNLIEEKELERALRKAKLMERALELKRRREERELEDIDIEIIPPE